MAWISGWAFRCTWLNGLNLECKSDRRHYRPCTCFLLSFSLALNKIVFLNRWNILTTSASLFFDQCLFLVRNGKNARKFPDYSVSESQIIPAFYFFSPHVTFSVVSALCEMGRIITVCLLRRLCLRIVIKMALKALSAKKTCY